MAKVQKIAGIRGMNDILPSEAPIWEYFEECAHDVLRSYGYKQIRTPILEATSLFKRGIGEVTDIVEKEMYCFTDSLNGEQLALRPENTAGVVRSVIEHNLTYNAPQRLWYFGPMFRHERPQRGRYRQFHQLGVEALGFKGPDVDVEQILMARRLFDELEILPLKLELNSLGNLDERLAHREALIKYFEANQDVLDEDAKRRLYSNPLRILDTKNPDMQQMVEGAPKLLDYLKEDSLAFLKRMEELLSVAGVDYTINPRLVRGLDYYNHTVYEWVTDKLGAQATVCGGGRYDPLIEMLGGRPTPAVGFAMGVERVLEVMRECGFESAEPDAEVYVLHQGGASQGYAMMLGEILRDAFYEVIVHAGEASLKSQMKKADQSGAKYALICGEDEAAHRLFQRPARMVRPVMGAFDGRLDRALGVSFLLGGTRGALRPRPLRLYCALSFLCHLRRRQVGAEGEARRQDAPFPQQNRGHFPCELYGAHRRLFLAFDALRFCLRRRQRRDRYRLSFCLVLRPRRVLLRAHGHPPLCHPLRGAGTEKIRQREPRVRRTQTQHLFGKRRCVASARSFALGRHHAHDRTAQRDADGLCPRDRERRLYLHAGHPRHRQ